jgi:hypothetical protein
MGSPNLRAIFVFGPVYLAIFFVQLSILNVYSALPTAAIADRKSTIQKDNAE